MTLNTMETKHIIEAALLVAEQPLTLMQLKQLFEDTADAAAIDVQAALVALAQDYESRGIELKQVATGYRIQARPALAPWLTKLNAEKPPKYSRAVLETLVLIAYRQPITRAEIEEIRGVSASSPIIKTLLDRNWVRVVGHREVPGRPALLATTPAFLDYFNLKTLEALPTLMEIQRLIPKVEEAVASI